MMMFALSKINLLILVVALFTVIVYFTFGFQNVLLTNIASQEAAKVVEQASFLINSSNICGSIEVSVPEKLQTASGQGYFFVMEIRSVDLGEKKSLVFSIINRDEYFRAKKRDEEPFISASGRRDIDAEIHLFGVDTEDSGRFCIAETTMLGINIGARLVDNVVIVIEVVGGQEHVYLIPCFSSNKEHCMQNTQEVACWIWAERGEASNCFDTPSPAECSGYPALVPCLE